VANSAPDFYDKDQPRANLYTNSIVALDVCAGKLAWYDQAVPHDVRDYDLTHGAPIFTTTVGGQQGTLIALTGKDGLLRVLDRDTHNVHFSTPSTTGENAEGLIGPSFTHVCPDSLAVTNGTAPPTARGSAHCSCRRPIGATSSDRQRSRPRALAQGSNWNSPPKNWPRFSWPCG